MARKVRSHLLDSAEAPDQLAPKHLTKQEFAKRLYQLMVTRGWRQSDLARQADLPRDSVSTYIRGRVLPTPQNLGKLAKALGVTPEDLLPNYTESAIDEDFPSVELRVSPGSPSKAWLRVNRLVSLTTAVKVVELLENDKLPDRD